MNRNKKALGIMLGTLVFLLVLAVVLLSVIIVSLAKEENPVITTEGKQTEAQTSEQSSQIPQTSDQPATGSTQTSQTPQTSDEPVITTDTENPTTEPSSSSTSESRPTTTLPNVTPNPTVQRPNVAVGDIVTVENADGSIVRSGAFRDNGPTGLHMIIEWEAGYASKDATTVNLTVRVYMQCYSIGVAARNNGTLTVNGDTSIFSTPGIFYSTNETHHTLLTARSMTITKNSAAYSTEVDLDAAWNCKLTYSGVYYEWLTAAGTIEV